MCSVAKLVKPHSIAQTEHVEESYRAYDSVFDFSIPGDLDPIEYQRRREELRRQRTLSITPSEGWLSPRVLQQGRDPFLIGTTCHDIVPRELLREQDPETKDHSGTDVICRAVANEVRSRIEQYDLFSRLNDKKNPLHEHFTVHEKMVVHVVNIVHSSYCTLPRAEKHDIKTIFPSTFMWRRLAFLGCQENDTHTSLKISFKPPFKASKLFFATGRVLETGASNENVSHLTFFDATLEYFRQSGLHGLLATSRSSQNIVAKSSMPDNQRLLLDLMRPRLGEKRVTYEKELFAGAVMKHHTMQKVMLLAFSAGSIVCVGPKDVSSMRTAILTFYDTLKMFYDTPENRALLERYRQADMRLEGARKRKRNDEDEMTDDI